MAQIAISALIFILNHCYPIFKFNRLLIKNTCVVFIGLKGNLSVYIIFSCALAILGVAERDENCLPPNTQKSEEQYGRTSRNTVAPLALRFYKEIEFLKKCLVSI